MTNDYKKYKEVKDSKRQEENKQRVLKARQEALEASQQQALEEAREDEEFRRRAALRRADWEEEFQKIDNARKNSVLGKLSSYLGF